MNDKIKRFTFYNIFFLCAFCCLFMVLGLRSFADTSVTVNSISWNNRNNKVLNQIGYRLPSNKRYCLYIHNVNGWTNPYGEPTRAELCCNSDESFYQSYYTESYVKNSSDEWYLSSSNSNSGSLVTPYRVNSQSNLPQYFPGYSEHPNFYVFEGWGNEYQSSSGLPVFYNLSDVYAYIDNGTLPVIPYDDTLELDSFKVTTWGIGNLQVLFKSRFEVTWSDSRISTVQVIIKSSGGSVSFEGSSSPFKQKFEPELYVLKKGDVVHLTATPYMADGTYGTSLYYSFVFDDNVPGSNIYRKFTNTPYSDNTLTIPYTGVSGQPQSVTAPVDGVTTQNVYKVNYNPQTYEYGDINLYEVYYSPVIVYPSDTTDEEIDETQDVINNTYTTNNYYETTKNINIDFDVSFGDISGSDIQHGFDDFGNFSNGFGGFIAKLSTWVLALFPFLSPVVSIAIVFMFGLIVLLAIIALVLKIASVIADLIPF